MKGTTSAAISGAKAAGMNTLLIKVSQGNCSAIRRVFLGLAALLGTPLRAPEGLSSLSCASSRRRSGCDRTSSLLLRCESTPRSSVAASPFADPSPLDCYQMAQRSPSESATLLPFFSRTAAGGCAPASALGQVHQAVAEHSAPRRPNCHSLPSATRADHRGVSSRPLL